MTDNPPNESNQRSLAFAAIAVLALVVFAFVAAKAFTVTEHALELGERYVKIQEDEASRVRQHTTTTWEQNGRQLEVDQDRAPNESIREWHEAHAKSVAQKRDVERDIDLSKPEHPPQDPNK
jgi:hypothetical protein